VGTSQPRGWKATSHSIFNFLKSLCFSFFNLSSVFQVGFFPKDYVREVSDSYNFHMD